nr:MAG TPA: hypothetical protein [Caudoviricetes sp.]
MTNSKYGGIIYSRNSKYGVSNSEVQNKTPTQIPKRWSTFSRKEIKRRHGFLRK